MQTAPLPALGNLPSGSVSAHPEPAEQSASEGFGQLLAREVAQRRERGTQAPAADEAVADALALAGTQPAVARKTAAIQAAPADKIETAPSELLNLVASIAQLQAPERAEGDAAGDEALPADAGDNPELPSERVITSPFASTQSALGARANHGLQSRPEGSWAAQVERSAARAIESGATASTAGNAPASAPLTSATPAPAARTEQSAPDLGTAGKDTFQAALSTAATAARPPLEIVAPRVAEHLAPRLGSAGWDQALGQRIVWMVQGEQQTASLTLNPPELGPLKVVLQIANAQANAAFVAAQPEVRQALEAAMPRLREMLADAGIQLGQATVDSGAADQRNSGEQSAQRQALRDADPDAGPVASVAGDAMTTSMGRGLVDTFA